MVAGLRSVFAIALYSVGVLACSGAGYDAAQGTVANGLKVGSSVDAANIFLSKGDCANALAQILPLYNSANSNSPIRYATAAAYGCSARVDLLSNLNSLVSYQSSDPLGLIFELAAKLYPSVSNPDDKVPLAAEYGTDAAQSILKDGTILIPAYEVNATSNNPGSLLVADRMNDANSYLTFLSLSLMGSLENRYGLPSSNYHKSTDLPWTTATTTSGDGCAYASAVLNFLDGLSYIQSAAPPNVAAIYKTIQTITPQMHYGCCIGLQACGFNVNCGDSKTCGTSSTCTSCTDCANCPSLCTSCPTTLRSRSSCTGVATDQNSCAAAGLVSQVNNVFWSGPP